MNIQLSDQAVVKLFKTFLQAFRNKGYKNGQKFWFCYFQYIKRSFIQYLNNRFQLQQGMLIDYSEIIEELSQKELMKIQMALTKDRNVQKKAEKIQPCKQNQKGPMKKVIIISQTYQQPGEIQKREKKKQDVKSIDEIIKIFNKNKK